MLDPIIHQPTRLQIMAALNRNRELSFAGLLKGLGLSDGNLGAQLRKLDEAGYVQARDRLVGVGFERRYSLTTTGSAALRGYLAEIRRLIEDPVSREDADANRGIQESDEVARRG